MACFDVVCSLTKFHTASFESRNESCQDGIWIHNVKYSVTMRFMPLCVSITKCQSYGVPLKLKNFIWYCFVRVLLILRVMKTRFDEYTMRQESCYAGVLDNPSFLNQKHENRMK